MGEVRHGDDEGASNQGSSSCSNPPAPALPSPNTLVLFDWDDSLISSSWITSQKLLTVADSFEGLPEDAQAELLKLEDSVYACLTLARKYGSLIIITNAEDGWVQLSAARFFRRLVPLLRDVPTVSARSNFEKRFPGAPLSWKAAAFAYVIHEHYCKDFRAPKMVISVGDSHEEKIALKIAAQQHDRITTKAVKLLPQPGPALLAMQLDIVRAHFGDIIAHEGNLDLCISTDMVAAVRAGKAAVGMPIPACGPSGRAAGIVVATAAAAAVGGGGGNRFAPIA